MLAWNEMIVTKINPQWGLAWWSLDQESSAYSSEPAWHVFVTLRPLDHFSDGLLSLGESSKYLLNSITTNLSEMLRLMQKQNHGFNAWTV